MVVHMLRGSKKEGMLWTEAGFVCAIILRKSVVKSCRDRIYSSGNHT